MYILKKYSNLITEEDHQKRLNRLIWDRTWGSAKRQLDRVNKDYKKLMPFLHLPIQSGSNKILKLMNRKHDREYYMSIIEKLKKVNKDIKISSDFIVGYPGETEEDFQDTIKIAKDIKFINSYLILKVCVKKVLKNKIKLK